MTAAKPRIRRDRVARIGGRSWLGWRCDGGGCTGFAAIPSAAYAMWRFEREQQEKRQQARVRKSATR